MKVRGISINGKVHTYTDLGAIVLSAQYNNPEPKRLFDDIPAMNGKLDYSNYYGGMVVGITAIFSAVNKVLGQDIHALYNISDLPDYRSYSAENCKLCKNHVPIDAICNSFGYSKLT